MLTGPWTRYVDPVDKKEKKKCDTDDRFRRICYEPVPDPEARYCHVVIQYVGDERVVVPKHHGNRKRTEGVPHYIRTAPETIGQLMAATAQPKAVFDDLVTRTENRAIAPRDTKQVSNARKRRNCARAANRGVNLGSTLADHSHLAGVCNAADEPLVISDAISNWPSLRWTPENIGSVFRLDELEARIGRCSPSGKASSGSASKTTQWDHQCSRRRLTVDQLEQFVSESGDFSEEFFYIDYKHIRDMPNTSDLSGKAVDSMIDWSVFNLHDKDGSDSTFWYGSRGAFTQCHQDTYGCNLVAQLYGWKRWILFPPDDAEALYPTRLPFEESSVFSSVLVTEPDFNRFPAFRHARPRVVDLEAGQVLFVPHRWWHHVQTLSPAAISVNVWLDHKEDGAARLCESLARCLVSSVKGRSSMLVSPSEAHISTQTCVSDVRECVDDQLAARNLEDALLAVQPAKRPKLEPQADVVIAKYAVDHSQQCRWIGPLSFPDYLEEIGMRDDVAIRRPAARQVAPAITFQSVLNSFLSSAVLGYVAERLIDEMNESAPESTPVSSRRRSKSRQNMDDVGTEAVVEPAADD